MKNIQTHCSKYFKECNLANLVVLKCTSWQSKGHKPGVDGAWGDL